MRLFFFFDCSVQQLLKALALILYMDIIQKIQCISLVKCPSFSQIGGNAETLVFIIYLLTFLILFFCFFFIFLSFFFSWEAFFCHNTILAMKCVILQKTKKWWNTHLFLSNHFKTRGCFFVILQHFGKRVQSFFTLYHY